ncbi:MAG: hypothetical protein WBO77_00780 [Microgenomates group bacterium]
MTETGDPRNVPSGEPKELFDEPEDVRNPRPEVPRDKSNNGSDGYDFIPDEKQPRPIDPNQPY